MTISFAPRVELGQRLRPNLLDLLHAPSRPADESRRIGHEFDPESDLEFVRESGRAKVRPLRGRLHRSISALGPH